MRNIIFITLKEFYLSHLEEMIYFSESFVDVMISLGKVLVFLIKLKGDFSLLDIF